MPGLLSACMTIDERTGTGSTSCPWAKGGEGGASWAYPPAKASSCYHSRYSSFSGMGQVSFGGREGPADPLRLCINEIPRPKRIWELLEKNKRPSIWYRGIERC